MLPWGQLVRRHNNPSSSQFVQARTILLFEVGLMRGATELLQILLP